MPRRHALLTFATWLSLLGCTHRELRVSRAVSEITGDGREHLIATISGSSDLGANADGVPVSALRLDTESGEHSALYLRAPVRPDHVNVFLRENGQSQSIHLVIGMDVAETSDGTPDWMRLHQAADRQAFRRWFTALADRVADTSPTQLPPEITDCASFIRYAYREALRAHDDRWYAQFPALSVPALPSVQQWNYTNTPLGPNLYRTRPGPFRVSDLSDGTFTQFADAKTLLSDNAYLLGRNLHVAKPGDLIFYRVLETNSQYHSMIITGEHGEWVVYNTGPDHGHHGEMRRVLLADLLRHPDPQWRPEPSNPNWLGVYRWNILRED